MRQTGRTTRIVNFAIDQLLSCGSVIVTDHAVFEGRKTAYRTLIDKVYEHWNRMCYSENTNILLKFREHHIEPYESLPGARLRVIHFYLTRESN